jgi:hypothetical protein
MASTRQFSARIDTAVLDRLERRASRGDRALQTVAEMTNLTVEHVRTAIGYYSGYTGEIDERIRQNQEIADESEERWRREQHLIA